MTEQKTKVQSKRRPDEKKMLLNINGKDIEAREGQTILEAAREYDIYIPSLCFWRACTSLAAAACAWWKWRARATWWRRVW